MRLSACHDLEGHGIYKVFAIRHCNYNYDSTPALAHAIYILQSTILGPSSYVSIYKYHNVVKWGEMIRD